MMMTMTCTDCTREADTTHIFSQKQSNPRFKRWYDKMINELGILKEERKYRKHTIILKRIFTCVDLTFEGERKLNPLRKRTQY